jgi:hypothetical protein
MQRRIVMASETRWWVLGAPDPEMAAIEALLREAGEHVVYALGSDGQRVRPDNAYRVATLSAEIPPGARVYRVECDGPAIPSNAKLIDHHRPGDPGYGRPPREFLAASSVGQTIAHLARCGALERVVRWHAVEDYPSHAWVWCGDPHPPPGSLRLTHPDAGVYDLRGALAYGVTWVRNGWVVVIHQWGEASGAAKYRGSVWIPRRYVLAAAADHCLAAAYRGECPGVDPKALMRWRIAARAFGRCEDIPPISIQRR